MIHIVFLFKLWQLINVFNEYIEEFAYKVFQLRPQKLKLKLYILIQFKCIISSFMRFAKVFFYKKRPPCLL